MSGKMEKRKRKAMTTCEHQPDRLIRRARSRFRNDQVRYGRCRLCGAKYAALVPIHPSLQRIAIDAAELVERAR